MPVETEIKLHPKQPMDQILQALRTLGFQQETPRQLESDQLYDLPDETLRRSGRLLRLRSTGGNFLLTYKGPTDRNRYKSREELQTHLEDGEILASILRGLGYTPTFRYEKYRSSYKKSGESGVVALDETPIGLFVELEGPPDWIDRTASQLGFSSHEYLTDSYAALYEAYRQSHPEVPKDMTF